MRVSKDIEAGSQFLYNLRCDYVDGHPKILPNNYFEHIQVEHGGFGEGTVIKVQMRVMGFKQRGYKRMESRGLLKNGSFQS
jgi:hypothetical protein